MLKKISILALLVPAIFFSCLEEVADARYYTLEVSLTPPDGIALADLTYSKVTVVDYQTGTETPYLLENGHDPLTLRLKSGQYGLRLISLSDDLSFNGLSSTKLYDDATVAIQMNTGGSNGLIIKEVYSSGIDYNPSVAWSTYWHDGFTELYNNSDETVYLDGIIVGLVDGNFGSASAWGNPLPADFYPMTNITFYFPGTGTDYPLAARTGIVIATKAINHNTSPFGSITPTVPMLDLRTADWEFFEDKAGTSDIDNPAVPNLLVMNRCTGYEMDWMPMMGGGYGLILARIPNTYGADLVTFAQNGANRHLKPGTSTSYLGIPTSAVFEAIDVTQAPASSRMNKLVLAKDDVGTVWYDDILGQGLVGTYSNKSIRRKVLGFTAADKPIYLDSNNSSEDFGVGGQHPPTPGVHPTVADAD